MRKVLALLAIMGLLFIGTAESTQLSKTYISRNNTGEPITTQVPITTIVPGITRIVGYRVVPIRTSGVGAWVTLYDSSARAQANIIGESETLTYVPDGECFCYPKAVKEGGLTIIQSCYSNVFIEYSR